MDNGNASACGADENVPQARSPGPKDLMQLLWHARQNDAIQLGRLLDADPALARAVDYDNRSTLHIAAYHGCMDAVRILVEHGAAVNATDRWGNSPLADAYSAGHSEVIRYLQSCGGQLLEGHQLTPPRQQSIDWEINPSEINLKNSYLIGKGSFGEIRKVTWRGTPVAVKTILPSLSDDKLVVQDFRHEVRLFVKLRHPNIVQFLGAVTKGRPLMLITEYLPEGDLHQVLEDKGPLHNSVAISFALDIARGMEYLHGGSRVIIHRDLKPRNLLMDEGKQLKVGDFGLSKLIKGKNPHDFYKLTGETGSYRYMAPEVFRHEPYDKSVDVFSFAMILYEMLEGSPPFVQYDAYDAAKLVANGQRPIFRAKQYTPQLKELIERCWCDDPEKRPLFSEIIHKLEEMEISKRDKHWHF